VEIWNLVFTQFNRVGNPPNNLRPLPSKNIDTGMGLERTAATLQGVDSNYHIDILKPIVLAAAEVCGVKYDGQSDAGRRLRRITDHVRACTFAMHENVVPGANKEKYVIRRLLRRAVLDGHQLGLREPFLFQLVPVVVQMMKGPYPELAETTERVQKGMKAEEANFFGTIDAGLARINKVFADMASQGRVIIHGEEAAELYQTYGVPPELVESMAAESNFAFDWGGFREAMKKHGELSGKIAETVFGGGPLDALKRTLHRTTFLGYETTEAPAEVKGIVARGHLVSELREVGRDQSVTLVLDRTPFYGESGGQVGDTGEIVGTGFRFQVSDTHKDSDLILHIGHLVEGMLKEGAKVTARVDGSRRMGIRRAHSATHILHHALQKNLGKHAQQQGSKVDEDWLRFDFSNTAPIAGDQLAAIETDVHARVAEGAPIRWQTVPLAEARKAGAMMLFGEKYPDPVRMVSMGEFSRELCGGTHLENTRDVGPFEILTEEGVSAGTRRVVALTGDKARKHAEQTHAALRDAAETLGVGLLAVPQAARDLAQSVRDLKKQLASGARPPKDAGSASRKPDSEAAPGYSEVKAALRNTARLLNVGLFDVPSRVAALRDELNSLRQKLSSLETTGHVSADTLFEKSELIGSTRVVVAETPGANANLMRQWIDQLRKKANSTAILLAASSGDDKVTLVAGISRDLVDRGLSAGNWVRDVAPIVGGGGGGKPDMAQAGGKDPRRLPEAVATALELVRRALQA
jgi:alanyl-tRNA synthetase